MAENAKQSAVDPSALSTAYPEPEQIFKFQLRSIDEVAGEAVFVIDTNALLVPYRTGRDSMEAIQRTYKKLVKEKRLVIPAQVAREFTSVPNI